MSSPSVSGVQVDRHVFGFINVDRSTLRRVAEALEQHGGGPVRVVTRYWQRDGQDALEAAHAGELRSLFLESADENTLVRLNYEAADLLHTPDGRPAADAVVRILGAHRHRQFAAMTKALTWQVAAIFYAMLLLSQSAGIAPLWFYIIPAVFGGVGLYAFWLPFKNGSARIVATGDAERWRWWRDIVIVPAFFALVPPVILAQVLGE